MVKEIPKKIEQNKKEPENVKEELRYGIHPESA